MTELERKLPRASVRKQRDDILREAIIASIAHSGEPDAYFIINYLLERLVPDHSVKPYVERPLHLNEGFIKS